MDEAEFRAGFDYGNERQLSADAAWAAHSQKAPVLCGEPSPGRLRDCGLPVGHTGSHVAESYGVVDKWPNESPPQKAPGKVEEAPDHNRGLYGKYRVHRVDGSSAPGGKHEHCQYYVLDVTHDRHAFAALMAYSQSCAGEFLDLARDLRAMAYPMTQQFEGLEFLPPVSAPGGGEMDLGAAWNKLADAMHLINSIAGSTPVDSAKIVKAYAMVEDSHGIVQKACARLRTSITPVPQDGEPTMEKEIVAIRNYIASSALFYLEEGKKNRDEKHEMAQWGLSRIQARLRPTITPSPERQEGSDWKAECYKIGAAYVSALITIGALNKFVASSLEKAWDRHGACIFCCRHKSIGHSDICEMARANAEMLKMNSRPPTIPPEIPDNSPAPTAEKAPEVAE